MSLEKTQEPGVDSGSILSLGHARGKRIFFIRHIENFETRRSILTPMVHLAGLGRW
jgi:hypothetical protein